LFEFGAVIVSCGITAIRKRGFGIRHPGTLLRFDLVEVFVNFTLDGNQQERRLNGAVTSCAFCGS
jgi:hypothetical protein